MAYNNKVFSDSDVRIADTYEYGELLIALPFDSDLWNKSNDEIMKHLRAAKKIAKEYDIAQMFYEIIGHDRKYLIKIIENEYPNDFYDECLKNRWIKTKDKIWLQEIINNVIQQRQEKLFHRHISKSIREEIWQRDKGYCRYCGNKLLPKNFHIDHVIPFSAGGLTRIDNLVLACNKCNLIKHAKTPEQANMVLQQIGG